MSIERQNAEIILRNTTAYPFKLCEGSALVCVYCCDKCDSAAQFREHMATEHSDFKVQIAFAHIGPGVLKVECSELQCRLCGSQYDDVHDIAEHLANEHNETGLNLDFFLGVIPFKLLNGRFECVICDAKATCLRALGRHTLSHFRYHSCNSCGRSFATRTSLQRHISVHHSLADLLQCTTCKEPFAFSEDLKEHYLENKRCCKHLCRICGDRFYSWSVKRSHMEEVHGRPVQQCTCHVCGTVFRSQDKLRIHFVIEHTEDYCQCNYCGEKFRTEAALSRHIVFHTREKHYPCDVCGKSFFRQSTLNLHKWIHSDVKKYECEICDKRFNQKVNWKKHIENFHPDLMSEVEG